MKRCTIQSTSQKSVALCALLLCLSFAGLSSWAQSVVTVAGGYVADGGPATSASLSEPQGAVYDAAGNLYITDENNNRIRKVDPAGKISTIAGNGFCGFTGDNGPAVHAEICAPTGIAIDTDGNIFFADTANARIRKIDTTSKITRVAGSGVPAYCGDNGPATQACINNAQGVAIAGRASSGVLYIADTSNSRVRAVNLSTGIITTIAGTGTPGYSGDGGRATSGELQFPYNVATYPSNHQIWIADEGNNAVRAINTSSGIITTILGGSCGSDLHQLCNPIGLTVDKIGNLYVSDEGNYRVVQVAFENNKTTVSLMAGTGLRGFNGDGLPANSTQLFLPTGLTIDLGGGLVIADSGNGRIRKGGGAQPVSTLAGGYIGDKGPPTKAALNGAFLDNPLAFGPGGTLYFADSYNNRVRKIVPGTITTIAGTGLTGYSGDGGPATSAELFSPASVAADANGNVYILDDTSLRKIDPSGTISTFATFIFGFGLTVDRSGNVYVADFGSCVIRKFSPDGVQSVVAGTQFSCTHAGDGGPATAASIAFPTGVAVDIAGNLYIAAWQENRIRRVNADGIISTLAGDGTCGFDGDGGSASSAKLCAPLSVAVDNNLVVYIADTSNARIRKVARGIITTVAGTGLYGYNGNALPALQSNITPTAVAVSPKGILHFYDVLSQRIRKVQ